MTNTTNTTETSRKAKMSYIISEIPWDNARYCTLYDDRITDKLAINPNFERLSADWYKGSCNVEGFSKKLYFPKVRLRLIETIKVTEIIETTEDDDIDTDTYEKYKVLFVEFLKKHGAYEKYRSNLPKSKAKGLFAPDFLGKTEYDDRYVDFLCLGFVWKNTPEGHDYWDNLDTLWNQILMETILMETKEKDGTKGRSYYND